VFLNYLKKVTINCKFAHNSLAGEKTGDKMKKFLSFGAVLTFALSASAAWQVGQTPSDFTLSDWDGGNWNLYSQRGKVVLINFGATW
jgi:hypothetical protein